MKCRCPENGIASDCPIHSVQYRDPHLVRSESSEGQLREALELLETAAPSGIGVDRLDWWTRRDKLLSATPIEQERWTLEVIETVSGRVEGVAAYLSAPGRGRIESGTYEVVPAAGAEGGEAKEMAWEPQDELCTCHIRVSDGHRYGDPNCPYHHPPDSPGGQE